ncbi:MAG: ATP-grasp fold amidoligase family protein [Prevotellaceae bacterium]|nr:ATP-grasp fold amidoligase family protein [Prevotellaceae bacterium]
MGLASNIKHNIENNHPALLRLLLGIRRGTLKPVCDWPEDKFVKGVMETYKRHMGYTFDLNNPNLFTEKLQWYKCYYSHPDFERITDKYLFKQYVAEKLGEGYTLPAYGAWTSVDDLEKDWDKLPEDFVLKANLQSDGRNIKIIHHKSEIEFSSIKSMLRSWLHKNNTLNNSWEYRMYCGTPRILAEQYMANFADQLYDYKLFCFKGKPHCMYVATDHFDKQNYPITFYDMNWSRLDVKYGLHVNNDVPKPPHFDDMKRIAEVLSNEFPFIRVDFFDTDEKLYVAELTFCPGGGCTKYDPISFNQELGDLLELPLN